MPKSREVHLEHLALLLKLEDQARAIKHLWLTYAYNDDRTVRYLNGMHTILDEIDELKEDQK